MFQPKVRERENEDSLGLMLDLLSHIYVSREGAQQRGGQGGHREI